MFQASLVVMNLASRMAEHLRESQVGSGGPMVLNIALSGSVLHAGDM